MLIYRAIAACGLRNEHISLFLPQSAKANDGQPIPPAPAVLPAAHSVADDVKHLPAPQAAKKKPNEKSDEEERDREGIGHKDHAQVR